MEDLKRSKKMICHNIFFCLIFVCILILNINTYAMWYEEPEDVVLKKEDSFWWLSKKKQKEKLEEIRKENEELLKNRKTNTKWIYSESDLSKFPKEKWEIIDDDLDFIGYNYYFDKNGYLLKDTITPDYKIVDEKGREVDYNLVPIKYELNNDLNSNEEITPENTNEYIAPTKEPSKVIIGEGVILKEKEKIYDNFIDKNMVSYVDNSYRFVKETKTTTYNKVKWNKCSYLKGDKSYVVFNNPNNNFNKVTGLISIEEYDGTDESTIITLRVYDQDKYEEYTKFHRIDEIDTIYEDNSFNSSDNKFTFTFDRTVKRLRFEIEVNGEYYNRKCLFKDLKYGFNKTKFLEELERKKGEEEEIRYLKELGIYVDDLSSFEPFDEDGNEIEEDEEEEEDENYTHYDDKDGYSYYSDEEDDDYTYEDKKRDRTTGPAFDEDLKNRKDDSNSGPAFIEENKNSTE